VGRINRAESVLKGGQGVDWLKHALGSAASHLYMGFRLKAHH